jgi:hypothetical protein
MGAKAESDTSDPIFEDATDHSAGMLAQLPAKRALQCSAEPGREVLRIPPCTRSVRDAEALASES